MKPQQRNDSLRDVYSGNSYAQRVEIWFQESEGRDQNMLEDVSFGGSRQVASCGMEFHLLKSSSEMCFWSIIVPAFWSSSRTAKLRCDGVGIVLHFLSISSDYALSKPNIPPNTEVWSWIKLIYCASLHFHAACCLDLYWTPCIVVEGAYKGSKCNGEQAEGTCKGIWRWVV